MALTSSSRYDSGTFETYYQNLDFVPADTHTYVKCDVRLCRTGTIFIKNDGSNSITYKVLGTLTSTPPSDDTDDSWFTIKADTAITSGNNAKESFTEEWSYVWVGVRNTTGGQANVADIYVRGQN